MGQNTLKNNIIYQDELITKLELKSKVYGNKELLIDTIDFNRVKMFCWYPHVAKTYNTFYARAKIPGTTRSIYIHRLIMSFPDKDIDHIDRNGLINTKSNLREVTISENMGNKIQYFKKNSKTKGVVFRFDGRKNPY